MYVLRMYEYSYVEWTGMRRDGEGDDGPFELIPTFENCEFIRCYRSDRVCRFVLTGVDVNRSNQ